MLASVLLILPAVALYTIEIDTDELRGDFNKRELKSSDLFAPQRRALDDHLDDGSGSGSGEVGSGSGSGEEVASGEDGSGSLPPSHPPPSHPPSPHSPPPTHPPQPPSPPPNVEPRPPPSPPPPPSSPLVISPPYPPAGPGLAYIHYPDVVTAGVDMILAMSKAEFLADEVASALLTKMSSTVGCVQGTCQMALYDKGFHYPSAPTSGLLGTLYEERRLEESYVTPSTPPARRRLDSFEVMLTVTLEGATDVDDPIVNSLKAFVGQDPAVLSAALGVEVTSSTYIPAEYTPAYTVYAAPPPSPVTTGTVGDGTGLALGLGLGLGIPVFLLLAAIIYKAPKGGLIVKTVEVTG